jgi:predicted dinucleotide-binding enzyme
LQAEYIVWCPRATIADGLSQLKSYELKFSGKIVLDITNILYRVKDEDKEPFYGKSSSTEKVTLYVHTLIVHRITHRL